MFKQKISVFESTASAPWDWVIGMGMMGVGLRVQRTSYAFYSFHKLSLLGFSEKQIMGKIALQFEET